MKTRILTIGISLITVMAFAQKKEIRNAEDAIEEGNYAKAKSLLQKVESLIPNEKDRTKADFYLAKGQAYSGIKEGTEVSLEDLKIAIEAFQNAEELGEKEDALVGIASIKNILVQAAIEDQNAEKYIAAADKLYTSYTISKKDTSYLYYAAANSVNSKDYDNALKYYKMLVDLGYSGAKTQYIATEKESGEQVNFNSKEQRDLFVKTGKYTNPTVKKIPSKSGEIAKNIALIYIQLKQPKKAIKAMSRAKSENPDDVGLLQAEANMYYKMGKIDMYNKLMKEIIKKDPNNPTLYYNLAVASAQKKHNEDAIKYYKKALELDPEMINAYINLSVVMLDGEQGLIKKMNEALKEGDMAAYNKYSNKRKAIYKKALPYLEKAQEIKPNSIEVTRTLMNIYYILKKTEKAKNMNAKLDALKAAK